MVCNKDMRIPPDQTTHGKSRTKVYRAWQQMKQRCFNKKNKGFGHYGGRGVIVCARWRDSFENFYKDMGEPPTKNHSIDRINNDGNYEPNNCRWATIKQQNQNQTKTIYLTYKGKTKTISEWSREIGISIQTMHSRRRLGFSVERILEPKKYVHKK